MKEFLTLAMVLLMAPVIVFSGGSREVAEAEGPSPVTLKMATAFTLSTQQEVGARMFIDKVEDRLGDRVIINYVGGPEAIDSFELIEAVRNGIVDIGGLPGSYFQSVVPETASMYLSQVTPADERANGAYEIYETAIAEQANAHYLGRYNTSYKFNFYAMPEIRAMSDFRGVKFRISPVYREFLTALGGTPVTMPHSEVYTGLERGLVEGIGVTNFGVIERGWHDRINYVIDPAFYGSDQAMLVNLDTWTSLPEDLKEELTAIIMEVESESGLELQKIIDQERIDLVDQGVQVITIANPGEYLKIAYDSAWAAILEAIPQTGGQLKELITR